MIWAISMLIAWGLFAGGAVSIALELRGHVIRTVVGLAAFVLAVVAAVM
jgi:hypothetical protein